MIAHCQLPAAQSSARSLGWCPTRSVPPSTFCGSLFDILRFSRSSPLVGESARSTDLCRAGGARPDVHAGVGSPHAPVLKHGAILPSTGEEGAVSCPSFECSVDHLLQAEHASIWWYQTTFMTQFDFWSSRASLLHRKIIRQQIAFVGQTFYPNTHLFFHFGLHGGFRRGRSRCWQSVNHRESVTWAIIRLTGIEVLT